jgi:hypothetical protein
MKKKFIQSIPKILFASLTFIALFFNLLFSKTYAQITCANENVLFLETFGTGTTVTTNPDIITSALTYHQSGPLVAEETYRVADSTQQKPEWHFSGDHTPGDVDGKMLVINSGASENFYVHEVSNPNGFAAGSYSGSFYLMNVDDFGVCGATALLPNMAIKVQYLTQDSVWQGFDGSPFLAPPLAQSADPVWVAIGATFTLPSTVTFKVTNIRIVIGNATQGGCGNDIAIDDIKLAFCPEGGPLPVQLLNFNAHQKGSGVSVEWSTEQENNSKSFEVERSSDGNGGWITVATVNAAGNSSAVKNYNAYDAKPLGGVNFYRLKQIDKDGVSKYSKTVRVNINSSKTGVSVLTNPFHNSVTIDFLSSVDQTISLRLVDITGRQVAVDKWAIQNGSTRKELSNVSTLQQGMYILTVSDANGQVLYNNKVIKQ